MQYAHQTIQSPYHGDCPNTVHYACLYKSYGQTADGRKAEDITVSLLRETKPERLLLYFTEHGYLIKQPYKGIYYIEGKIPFPVQIIVTGKLYQSEHTWLRALSAKMKKQESHVVLFISRIFRQPLFYQTSAFAFSVMAILWFLSQSGSKKRHRVRQTA